MKPAGGQRRGQALSDGMLWVRVKKFEKENPKGEINDGCLVLGITFDLSERSLIGGVAPPTCPSSQPSPIL